MEPKFKKQKYLKTGLLGPWSHLKSRTRKIYRASLGTKPNEWSQMESWVLLISITEQEARVDSRKQWCVVVKSFIKSHHSRSITVLNSINLTISKSLGSNQRSKLRNYSTQKSHPLLSTLRVLGCSNSHLKILKSNIARGCHCLKSNPRLMWLWSRAGARFHFVITISRS